MKPTKVKIVKKIYSGIYIHSHPFGGVKEARKRFNRDFTEREYEEQRKRGSGLIET